MAELFDRYASLVYSIALRVLREPDLAENLTHAMLLEVWRHPGGFASQHGSLAAWLALTTRNQAMDVLRRKAQLTPLTELALPEPRNLRKVLEDDLRMDRVREAVKALPQEEQAVLYMAYFEGRGYAEIAERVEEPLEAVKTQAGAALNAVREALGA